MRKKVNFFRSSRVQDMATQQDTLDTIKRVWEQILITDMTSTIKNRGPGGFGGASVVYVLGGDRFKFEVVAQEGLDNVEVTIGSASGCPCANSSEELGKYVKFLQTVNKVMTAAEAVVRN